MKMIRFWIVFVWHLQTAVEELHHDQFALVLRIWAGHGKHAAVYRTLLLQLAAMTLMFQRKAKILEKISI